MEDNQLKYIKYKKKYLQLKSKIQSGGCLQESLKLELKKSKPAPSGAAVPLLALAPPLTKADWDIANSSVKTGGGKKITGSVVYSFNPKDGKLHFALARKVPYGYRVNVALKDPDDSRKIVFPKVCGDGAAGTNQRFWGKYATLGGGVDSTANTFFDAAIKEIIDEGGFNGSPLLKSTYGTLDVSNYTKFFTLELIKPINGDNGVLFLFFMNDFDKFQSYFPLFPSRRGGENPGPYLVTNSHGEIDYVSSMEYVQMVNNQNKEVKTSGGENLIVGYVWASFLKFILPFLKSKYHKNSELHTTIIKKGKDSTHRIISRKERLYYRRGTSHHNYYYSWYDPKLFKGKIKC